MSSDEIVGVFGGKTRTLQGLREDYYSELVEVASVCLAAIRDWDAGEADLDPDATTALFGEVVDNLAKYAGFGYGDGFTPIRWAATLGKELGGVCQQALLQEQWGIVPADGMYRSGLVWLAAYAIDAMQKVTAQDYEVVYARILAERERQNGKWGPQHNPPPIWAAILAEEVGEVAQAAMRVDLELVRAMDGGPKTQ